MDTGRNVLSVVASMSERYHTRESLPREACSPLFDSLATCQQQQQIATLSVLDELQVLVDMASDPQNDTYVNI